jgi:PAS domain S-box-containing protein
MVILKNYTLIKEIFNTIPTGIVVIDDDLKILYANQAVEDLTGIEPSLLLNKDVIEQFQGIDESSLVEAIFKGSVRTKKGFCKAESHASGKYRILYLS